MIGVVPGVAAKSVAEAPAPVQVQLGTHQFGKLTAPEATVASIAAGEVGWNPGNESASYGPWSFEVGANGTVWLLDELNQRLLGWPQGGPERPTLVVPLPVQPSDFALGPGGSFYVTTRGEPPELPEVVGWIGANGELRWRASVAADVAFGMLRRGPDGTVFLVYPGSWIPVTTPAGNPLPVAEQQRLTQPQQPLAGGGHLVVTPLSNRNIRVAVTDAADQPTRSWEITSDTDIGAGRALPAMVGDNPVIPLDVSNQPANGDPFQWEHLALQLTPTGALVPLYLDHAAWGDVITEYRVGADGSFYQLRSSPTDGVQIVRYAFTAAAAPAAPSNATTAQPAPTSQPAATGPATPAPAQPASDSTSRAWLAWTGAALAAAVAIVGGALLVWRRRRSAPGTAPDGPPTLDGPSAPDDLPDLSQPAAAPVSATHAPADR